MSNTLKRSTLALAVLLGSSSLAFAHDKRDHKDPKGHDDPPVCTTAPEVDPSLAIGGLSLLGGSLVVLRSRRRAV